ncbi:hypothetical protein TELCIR_20363 [Teladorsagia circumcincta]|uniref:Uncharacterized protein n=1 Tax=Teladorsagia circumcincta TaxID=45464 RepID=A0A2G9TJR2_TELCI|nr:hypothetical protein TELCIR_20363 [Teladorsagia circumcincta]
MEKNTRSVLVKSAMQGCGTKLIHSYNCQFDKAVLTRASQKSGSSQFKNCPAFVKVIENEDGVLDCVGFFDHLGHDEKSLIEGIDSTAKGKENAESKEPCFLCGNDVPPESVKKRHLRKMTELV